MGFRNVLVVLLFLFAVPAWAQDKLLMRAGGVLEVSISKETSDQVFYRLYSDPTGPEYSISKASLAKIVYTNGQEAVMTSAAPILVIDSVYKGRNMLSFAPILATENGFGLGFSFEQFIDKEGWVSYVLPISVSFSPKTDQFTDKSTMDPMFYFAPGIKIYTNMNSARKVKYTLGPSVVVATGYHSSQNSVNGVNFESTRESRFMLGAMVNGGINIFPVPHVYIGGEVGAGLTYVNLYDGERNGIALLTQLQFKVGYRF